jgi:xanthine dehydrogenase YagS FAD-binding subunit
MLSQFTYQRPATIALAVEAAGRPGTRIMAGGTDLLGCLRDGAFQANHLISLNGLTALKGVHLRTAGGLRIGALTTLTEVAENRQVLESYPVLAQAAASVGSPQLRNQGTLGGNLCQRPRCWYFRGDFHCLRKGGDTCFAEAGESQMHAIFGGSKCHIVHPSDTASALVALDARVSIAGVKGARVVPLRSFFVLPEKSMVKENVLLPGEIVTDVLIDPPLRGARSVYRKVRERGAFDFALAGAAIVLAIADGKAQAARVVLSGVAPIPWRSTAAEQVIVGKTMDAATIAVAAEAAVKGAVELAENGYKIPLVHGIVEETLTTLAM